MKHPHWTDEFQGKDWGKPDHWKTPINELEQNEKCRIQTDYQTVPGRHLMQRRVEVELLARVHAETRPMLYIELGAGDGSLMWELYLRSLELQEDDKAPDPLRFLGFEHATIGGLAFPEEIVLRFRNIFDPHTEREIRDAIEAEEDDVLIYCDNGDKTKELELVSRYCTSGDVIGCHDFGIEVPQDRVGFLEERGFEVCVEYEEWINKHLCLQRFWRKT